MRSDEKFAEIWRVTKEFPTAKGPLAVVKDFELSIARGELCCLLGHSGCGKSTVLSMVAGLTKATHGSIIVDDKEVSAPGPERAVVFQSPTLFPFMTALGNVRLAVDQVHPGRSAKERDALARKYLGLVGMADACEASPNALSQGMRQRVGIARAFALSPRMLLLDEPFGMLDSITRVELQETLVSIWSEHQITALMVTHDVDEALFLADRIVLMTNGPEARVGKIIHVPFERPRDRLTVLEDPRYDALRDEMLAFLEENDPHHAKVA
jgi:nitrate/nitrite transport system ATP-binding protein